MKLSCENFVVEKSGHDHPDIQLFCQKIKRKTDYVVRCPGRVNLIGEHVDYSGFSVLPASLDQATLISATKNSSEMISLTNLDEKYEPFEFSLNTLKETTVNERFERITWFNYVMAGMKATFDYGKSNNIHFNPKGFEATVGSISDDLKIPVSAGLSSSSALVVASAIVSMKIWDLNIPKALLAKTCAKYERLVGMEGGGMDQAIAVFGEKGKALLVDFSHPIIITNQVLLPDCVSLVIAHCGIEKEKANTNEYNMRVAECRLACALIYYCNDLEMKTTCPKLADLQIELHYLNPSQFLQEELKKLKKILPDFEDGKSLNYFKKLIKKNNLEALIPSNLKDVLDEIQFKPVQRFIHVLEEASRVVTFSNICKIIKKNGSIEQAKILGDLMNQSHESCSKVYECSLPELDELTEICRKNGALGSRLTGAGWGGCTVSMIKENDSDNFVRNVTRDYYSKKGIQTPKIFLTKPNDGAVIYKFC